MCLHRVAKAAAVVLVDINLVLVTRCQRALQLQSAAVVRLDHHNAAVQAETQFLTQLLQQVVAAVVAVVRLILTV